jgi:hypothetical protein
MNQMTISTEDIVNASPGDIITEYNDLLENWLLANGFDAKNADIYGKPALSKRIHIAKAAVAKNILWLVKNLKSLSLLCIILLFLTPVIPLK